MVVWCNTKNTPHFFLHTAGHFVFLGFPQPKMAATFVIVYRPVLVTRIACGSHYLIRKQTSLLTSHCAC